MTILGTTELVISPDRYAALPPELRGTPRDGVRLMVGTAGTPGAAPTLQHSTFRHLADFLNPGDVLVVNTSQTRPGQVDATDQVGLPVVLHQGADLGVGAEGLGRFVVEVRSAPDAATPVLDRRVGDMFVTAGGNVVTLLAPHAQVAASPTGVGNRLWQAQATGVLAAEKLARPISFGYVAPELTMTHYETIFGQVPGSAEMPSAARPMTAPVVAALSARGVRIVPVTLHTGLSSQDAGEPPQSEWFSVSGSTAAELNAAVARGSRVVAVGTSATRAVESAVGADGLVAAQLGWTDRFISPEFPPVVVNGVVTGWHNVAASHIELVTAVAGQELIHAAYAEALRAEYLWHEFGDSALFFGPTR